MERFPKETKELKEGKEDSKQSHLKPLTPIMDVLGGLRLTKVELPYDAPNPMIQTKETLQH